MRCWQAADSAFRCRIGGFAVCGHAAGGRVAGPWRRVPRPEQCVLPRGDDALVTLSDDQDADFDALPQMLDALV